MLAGGIVRSGGRLLSVLDGRRGLSTVCSVTGGGGVIMGEFVGRIFVPGLESLTRDGKLAVKSGYARG